MVAPPSLPALLRQIRACRACDLPFGPRPIVQAGAAARLLIIGQAPGSKVHASGVPWDDPSGERLRDWLGLGPEHFYDPDRVALMPMGFCYPGSVPGGGDAPPRPECAPLWHAPLLAALPAVRLTLLVGTHAQTAYAPRAPGGMTALVRAQAGLSDRLMALPHPAWRVVGWMRRNEWFEAETLPLLRARVAALFA